MCTQHLFRLCSATWVRDRVTFSCVCFHCYAALGAEQRIPAGIGFTYLCKSWAGFKQHLIWEVTFGHFSSTCWVCHCSELQQCHFAGRQLKTRLSTLCLGAWGLLECCLACCSLGVVLGLGLPSHIMMPFLWAFFILLGFFAGL